MRTLTAYKFVPTQEGENIASVLKRVFELTDVTVIEREVISFYLVNFDDYDELTEDEIAFLQEHFDGYYVVAEGKALEIYSGIKGAYLKTTPVLLAEMRERYNQRKQEKNL